MTRTFKTAAFGILLALANGAVALPIVSGSGITGLMEGGITYNMEFGDRGGATYAQVASDPARAITTGGTLSALLNEANSLLFNSGLGPGDIDGCSTLFTCVIDFPVFQTISGDTSGSFIAFDGANLNPVNNFVAPSNIRAEDSDVVTFGFITVAQDDGDVPAPATLALLGLGLAGLGWKRRKA